MCCRYIHGGGRIGVLIEAEADVVNDEIKKCLKNVAMQVAAMSPKYTSRAEVFSGIHGQRERNPSCSSIRKRSGKPENIIEKNDHRTSE